jgi:hypothetical protein
MACRKCGVDIAKPVDIVLNEEVLLSADMCFACLDAAIEEAKYWDSQFRGLISAGVSNEDANNQIIKRIDAHFAERNRT